MSRAGKRAFDRCSVAEVEFKDFLEVKEDDETHYYLREKLPADEKGKPHRHAGYLAVLHCPRTEDSRTEVTSNHLTGRNKLEALREVKDLAGELLCRHCRFSSMTPVEVAEERAKRALAEAEHTEALAALETARAELRAISPHALPAAPELPE